MKKSLAPRNVEGFSLVEVLVFTVVLGMFFVAAISVTVFNLKNMKIQEHKILATRYAEEAIEWVKQEKEDNWTDFIEKDTSAVIPSSGTTYCLNDDSPSWDSSFPCESYGLNAIFKREIVIRNSGVPDVNLVEVELTVYWEDMGTDLSVTIKNVFKLLE